ncbi:hypothetical protein [Bradyrhizobium sp. RT5a]|uniref:hypothetical protein n=1 Tax=unclassified Bradyrhizobium TaxID=2631580 RepID=UPI0033924959
MKNDEEWISAAEAETLLKSAFKREAIAQRTLRRRAHADLIRSRAQKFWKMAWKS